MGRIRLALLALAVLLAAGIGAIVSRAFELDATAQVDRHRRLAERIFDEIDDRLNVLLSTEDARSFHQYRYLYVPEGAVAADRAWIRSELSREPSEPYVLGWFQYDVDGNFRSPLRPEVDERAILTERWRATDRVESIEQALRDATTPLRSLPDFPRPPPPDPRDSRTAPPPPRIPARAARPADEGLVEMSLDRGAEAGGSPPSKPRDSVGTGGVRKETSTPKETVSKTPPSNTETSARKSSERKSKTLNKAAGRRSSRAPRQAVTSAANVYGLQQQVEVEEGVVAALEPDALGSERQTNPPFQIREGGAPTVVGVLDVVAEAEGVVQAAEGTSVEASRQARREALNARATQRDAEDRKRRQEAMEEALEELEEEALEAELLDDEYESDSEWADFVDSQKAATRREASGEPTAMERRLAEARRKRAEWNESEAGRGAVGSVAVQAAEGSVSVDATPPRESTNAAADSSGRVPVRVPLDLDVARDVAGVQGAESQVRADTGIARGATRPATGVLGSVIASPEVVNPAAETVRRRLPATDVLAGPAELQTSPGEAEVDGDLTLTISQLQALPTDGERLVLYRKVSAGPRTFLQGVVLTLPALAEHLEREVVEGTDLAGYVVLQWNGAVGRAAPGYAFDHVFAAPFEGLFVTASFEPVPRESSGPLPFLMGVTALLILAIVFGLFAVYRMVAVVVGFAEQRNNFVSAVSHELKTPLTAIRMYSEMLRDDIVPTEEKRYEYYATITAESERLSRLINNVLELAKLEKGTRSVSLSVGVLSPVLQEAMLVLSPHARSRGFTLELDVSDALPPVSFEHDALLQVLINLVDNALKFSASAEEKVVVLQARPSPDGGVVLRVRDRGPGVPSLQLQRIFQPFFRGERELTRKTKGTGIGLALVQGLVECMGGRVTARNHPAGGFEVEIGLAAAPA